MAKTSVINHITGAKYIKLFEDFIAICAYQVSTEIKGTVIKHNNCAAALLAFYEHRHNGILSAHGDKKTAVNLKQESSNSFLEKCLLFHYSQKTIKEANEFLENEGFITIYRNRVGDKENAPNDIVLNVDVVNFMLSEYDKINVGKNYPTLILPNPYRKITLPPTVKLPYPYGNFTGSNNKENDNVNNNHNNGEETPPTNENEITSFNALENEYDGAPFSGMADFLKWQVEKEKSENLPKEEKKVAAKKERKKKVKIQDVFPDAESFEIKWRLRYDNKYPDIDPHKLWRRISTYCIDKNKTYADYIERVMVWYDEAANKTAYHYDKPPQKSNIQILQDLYAGASDNLW